MFTVIKWIRHVIKNVFKYIIQWTTYKLYDDIKIYKIDTWKNTERIVEKIIVYVNITKNKSKELHKKAI